MDSSSDTPNYWRRCSSCKQPISFEAKYWVCNVSTCNRKRTGLAFCTVSCWDAHVPLLRHRESWAEERFAPTKKEFLSPPLTSIRKREAPCQNSGETKEPLASNVSPVPQVKTILRKKQ